MKGRNPSAYDFGKPMDKLIRAYNRHLMGK